MTVPIKAQIRCEIDWLTVNKKKIRRRTGFGDDNWAAIDAQIAVLTNNLNEDKIYDQFGPIDEETGEPDDDGNRHIIDHALSARRWLDGESEEDLSEGWKELIEE